MTTTTLTVGRTSGWDEEKGERMDLKALTITGMLERAAEATPAFARNRAMLIPLLHRIQDDQGYLSPEMLQALSRRLSIPLSEIYGVASFYDQFHFSPRGRTVVRVCTGTACHVKGASEVLSLLQERFQVEVGGTTPDLVMTLETVSCIGCCGLAPVISVNTDVVGELSSEGVDQVIERIITT
jgi:NADH-quinone oxidoreductase subunit E